MSHEIEMEKTYLAKFLPEGLKDCRSKEILDIYVPKGSAHAKLRIRKSGETYTITKKNPVGASASIQNEENIAILPEEFEAFAGMDGNRMRKIRYYYPYQGLTAEIDVFLEQLEGLVLVDFEFNEEKKLNDFIMPDFCLADVTEEEEIAGGVLCHHSFASLEEMLERFSYKKISL